LRCDLHDDDDLEPKIWRDFVEVGEKTVAGRA
jgi:hypothetical protein